MQLHDPARPGAPAPALIAVACVLQVAHSPQVSILGGTFNFMLVLSLVLALSRGPGPAGGAGFACGLFFDLTSTAPVGLMALILTLSAFTVSFASRGSLGGLNADTMRFIGVAALIANMAYGLCLFFLGDQGDLLWALGGHGISSTVLDLLAAAIFLAATASSSSQRGFSARGRGTRYKVLK